MKPSKKHRTGRAVSAAKPKPKPEKAGSGSRPRASSPAARVANTADILGGRPAPGKQGQIAVKWAANYRNLLDLRDRLLAQTGKLAKEATEGTPSYSMHMADAGTDSFDRDFALSMLSSDQDALYEISEALKRIENGSYGVCEVSGKPIPKGRLTAIPWARFSAEAQRQLERDGALKRRQLSAFNSLPAAETAEGEEGEEGSGEATEKD